MKRAQILKLCSQVGDLQIRPAPRVRATRVRGRVGPNITERAFVLHAERKGATLLRAGWPDYLMLHQGQTIAVEVKRDGYGISRRQARMFEALEAAGVSVYVWNPRRAALLIPWRKYKAVGCGASYI